MRTLMILLFFACAPHIAFGSNKDNNDFFNYGNMFSSKKTKKEEPKIFEKKIEEKTKTNEKQSPYPKYPLTMNIHEEMKVVNQGFIKGGNDMSIILEDKNSNKSIHHISAFKNQNYFLWNEGNLSIKFHTFKGRELNPTEYLEISTYIPPYLCAIGGYVTIKLNETIIIPKKDIQFINYKLNTDKYSVIGPINKDHKNYYVGDNLKDQTVKINYRAGFMKLKEIGTNTVCIYLHVLFDKGSYNYGFSHKPVEQDQLN